ncbi:hypothetical protein B0H13DRAFT_2670746 [Mycena leptocephala]|nr:hypothetical protein B0H13DRAFT_2670746 [Mycena leptocephala]
MSTPLKEVSELKDGCVRPRHWVLGYTRSSNDPIHKHDVQSSQFRYTFVNSNDKYAPIPGACASLRLHHSFGSLARGVRRRPGLGLLAAPCARWRYAAVHIAPIIFFLLFTFWRNFGCT